MLESLKRRQPAYPANRYIADNPVLSPMANGKVGSEEDLSA